MANRNKYESGYYD